MADLMPSELAWRQLSGRTRNVCCDDQVKCDHSGDYEVLRDTIIYAFNPPDDDSAEPAIMTNALDSVWRFVVDQPCTCTVEQIADWDPCPRCVVLGRLGDRKIGR